MPELLTPADVAKALGVTEADVMASIEAGDLKAKKIGSAYRDHARRARSVPRPLAHAPP